jgi:capsular polysaccharide export protein
MQNRVKPVWEEMPSVVFGVCWWNHASVRAMFGNGKHKPVFVSSFQTARTEALGRNGCIIGWASRLSSENVAACHTAGIPLIRVEDGFLRSVGLGAGLAPASSLVADTRGIYYDASRPSDLECMLEQSSLSAEQRARGLALIQAICAARLTKYNLGGKRCCDPFPANRTKVLVPGQVADDASLLNTESASIDIGAAKNINIDLLRTVRANNPGAFIVYRPHPDVTSGLRKGRVSAGEALEYADRFAPDADIASLLEDCDKVETITSLTGFEALLRGKEVTVHGMPFYAGWGLTVDTTSSSRRTRRRNLDELIYFALVAYSHYVHPVSLAPCDPETAISTLSIIRDSKSLRLKNVLRTRLAWIGEKVNGHFSPS